MGRCVPGRPDEAQDIQQAAEVKISNAYTLDGVVGLQRSRRMQVRWWVNKKKMARNFATRGRFVSARIAGRVI